jgi:oligopeptide/dipeptide ABC transporter ATP-binding protein
VQYEPTTFGELFAEVYDDGPEREDTTATVELLADLAQGGPALELAVGTGRVALPLAARGVRVDGIEVSPQMVAKLRSKPGGDRVAVTIGDFADVAVDDSYALVLLVYNTLFNLATQDDQVRCFENVAEHDMSLVSHFSDHLLVMYAGQVMEAGTTRTVFDRPSHPYSRGLLDAFPSIRGPRVPLSGIPGSPPDLSRPPSGCRFHPRCSFAMEQCSGEMPPLYQIGAVRSRCHLNAPQPEPNAITAEKIRS